MVLLVVNCYVLVNARGRVEYKESSLVDMYKQSTPRDSLCLFAINTFMREDVRTDEENLVSLSDHAEAPP